MRVLVVDDDTETLEVIERALEREGHRVVPVRTASEAIAEVAGQAVDLVVLDVMLEESSGLELCAKLRREGYELPILFLSARGAVAARVDGLDAGGDDYLAKPFAIRELVARVRALGRRSPEVAPRRLEVGDLSLDFEARRAEQAGEEIPVTGREWEILRSLSSAKGRVVPFDALLESVWGESTEGTRASLEVLISRLRKKLEPHAGRPLIRTVRGHGYALERPS